MRVNGLLLRTVNSNPLARQGNLMAFPIEASRNLLTNAGAYTAIANRVAKDRTNYDRELACIRSDVKLVTWIIGVSMVLTLSVVGSVFAVWSHLGDRGYQLAGALQ